MRRRELLEGLLATAGGAVAGFRLPFADAADYLGKLFVFVQADGGWDPTSFCDPKANTPGEPVINHWAERDEIREAGNIAYAPFANNQAFFEKYYRRMLVINGVDAQTNSHTVGIVHNWSGRNSEGYPAMTALLAAGYGADLPVAYLSFGGYSRTGGTIRYTRLNNAELLRSIATPDIADEEHRYIGEADWASLRSRRALTAERLASAPGLLPMEARNRALYRSAFAASEGLKAYADAIPAADQLEQPVEFTTSSGTTYRSELRRQAQLAVLAFKTGVAVSADMWLGGFDTHDDHDVDQGALMANLTDSVDYLWDYAEAHGVADRLVVVMGSDFGRTNFYNSQDGKDPLADRQLRCHGEEPAVDQPCGGRDGRVAFCEEDQPGDAGARRLGRHDHLSEACAQGVAAILGNRELAGGVAVSIRQYRGFWVLQCKL